MKEQLFDKSDSPDLRAFLVWVPKLGGTDWDLAADGKRVAVTARVETPGESGAAPKQDHEIVMLLNFFDELRRKVPLAK